MKSIFMLVCIVLSGRAQGLDSHSLEEVMDANEATELVRGQSQTKLNERRVKFKNMRIELKTCEIELSDLLLPTHCFQLIRKMSRSDKIDQVLDVEGLQQKCLEAARITQTLDATNLETLPPACREIAAKKIQINRYKAGIGFEL